MKLAIIGHVVKPPTIEMVDGQSVAAIGIVITKLRLNNAEYWSNVVQCQEIHLRDDPADLSDLTQGTDVLIRGDLIEDSDGNPSLREAEITRMEQRAPRP